MVFAAASGRLAKDTQHRIVVQALRDINLSLRSGDRLGLVGSNGARCPDQGPRSPRALPLRYPRRAWSPLAASGPSVSR